MRLAVVLLSFTTVLVVGYALSQILQRNAAPDIRVVGGSVYDAGSVSGTQPVTHTFRIINPHKFAIGLSTLESGCSCTTATASASAIPPNGYADVILKVEPEHGKLSGSASFATSHGKKTVETWLSLTGNIDVGRK